MLNKPPLECVTATPRGRIETRSSKSWGSKVVCVITEELGGPRRLWVEEPQSPQRWWNLGSSHILVNLSANASSLAIPLPKRWKSRAALVKVGVEDLEWALWLPSHPKWVVRGLGWNPKALPRSKIWTALTEAALLWATEGKPSDWDSGDPGRDSSNNAVLQVMNFGV